MSLRIDNVTKKFGDHIAVDNLQLEIPEKGLFGFLGGNGAGKTTTFRMILGLLDPTSGEITWNGQKIDYGKSHLIGYLPEERGLYPKLKVKDQLVYLGRLRGMRKSDIEAEMEYWLDHLKSRIMPIKKSRNYRKGTNKRFNSFPPSFTGLACSFWMNRFPGWIRSTSKC